MLGGMIAWATVLLVWTIWLVLKWGEAERPEMQLTQEQVEIARVQVERERFQAAQENKAARPGRVGFNVHHVDYPRVFVVNDEPSQPSPPREFRLWARRRGTPNTDPFWAAEAVVRGRFKHFTVDKDIPNGDWAGVNHVPMVKDDQAVTVLPVRADFPS